MRTSLIAFAVSSSAALPVWAQDFYAGGALTIVQAEDSGIEADPINATGLAGFKINQTFSAEGEVSFTVAEDEVDGVDVAINYFGIFARASLPISQELSAHARIGYINGETEFTVAGETFTDDDGSVAFGFGGEYAIAPSYALRADVTFGEFDTTDATALSAGVVFDF